MSDEDKKPQINIECEVHEKKMIEKAAKLNGLSVAALLRFLAIKEYRRLEDDLGRLGNAIRVK